MTDPVRELVEFHRMKAESWRNRRFGRLNERKHTEQADLIESMAAALRDYPLPENYAHPQDYSRAMIEWRTGPLAEALKRMGEKDD